MFTGATCGPLDEAPAVSKPVISDWKVFLDNEDRLNLWAHRYGESGVQALAEELRRMPWRREATPS